MMQNPLGIFHDMLFGWRRDPNFMTFCKPIYSWVGFHPPLHNLENFVHLSYWHGFFRKKSNLPWNLLAPLMLASNESVYFGIPGLKKIHHPMALSPPKQGTFKDDDFHVPLWWHMLDLHPTHSSPWFLHLLWPGIGTFATSQHPWVGGRLDPRDIFVFAERKNATPATGAASIASIEVKQRLWWKPSTWLNEKISSTAAVIHPWRRCLGIVSPIEAREILR